MQCDAWLVYYSSVIGLYLGLFLAHFFRTFFVAMVQPQFLFGELICSSKLPLVAGLREVEVPLVQDEVATVLRKGGILEPGLVFFIHCHL